MKILITVFLIASCLAGLSQTKIEKTVPVQTGQKLEFNFDHPELIKLQTWDKREVLIKGRVSINRGEHDHAFELQVNTGNNIISIASVLKDKENIPHRLILKKGDAEYYFKASDQSDPAVQKFFDEHGREYSYMVNGIIKEIELEIFVPKGIESHVQSKYGLVEIKNFDAPLTVESKFGGIDATINKNSTGELIVRTQHGEILTNLDIKFDSNAYTKTNKWTEIHATPGNGPKYALESKYGKVYLRKPN